MKIVKKYYSEEAAIWKAAEEETDKENAHLSESQRAEKELTASIEAKDIMDKVDAEQRTKYHIVDLQKQKRFKELSEVALHVAEAAPMDISIDTEGFTGRIIMSGDCFMIITSSPEGMGDEVGTLFKEAESVTIANNTDGLIEMSFLYPLCSDISAAG